MKDGPTRRLTAADVDGLPADQTQPTFSESGSPGMITEPSFTSTSGRGGSGRDVVRAIMGMAQVPSRFGFDPAQLRLQARCHRVASSVSALSTSC